jgi:hypothetical protein
MSLKKINKNLLKYTLVLNVFLFIGIAICQISYEQIVDPYILYFSLLAGILNLYVFYDHLNVRPKREMDAEKSELMKELEQEAKRRKQRDQFQQN